MPLMLGLPAFAPVMMPPMRIVAVGSLAGHLISGSILGVAFALLHYGAYHRTRLGA